MEHKFLNKYNRTDYLFFFSLFIWFFLIVWRAFSDFNVTIQEGTNIYEEAMNVQNITDFLFSGNILAHQHLYHLLVYLIANLLNFTERISFIIIGRILSIIFACIGIIASITFIKRHVKNVNHNLAGILIMFHPLFFFYSFQAEPYSMLYCIVTLQLLTYSDIHKNKIFPSLFFLLSVTGYYTHFYFIFILLAECIHEFIRFIKQKTAHWIIFFTLFCLFIPMLYQVPTALNSVLKLYIDGYFPFSMDISLKVFATFFGITPLLFNNWLIYSLSLAIFIYTFFSMLKNRDTLPKIIIIYYSLLMGVFLLCDFAYGYLHGVGYPLMRHFISIVFPLIIILLMNSKKPLYSYVVFTVIVALFLTTNFKTVFTKYTFDGLSVIKYLQSLKRDQYVTLINPSWASYNFQNDYFPLNLYVYQRMQIYNFLYRDEIDPGILLSDKNTIVASLKNKIFQDSGEKIDYINDFMTREKTTKTLRQIMQQKGLKLSPYKAAFINTKKIKSYYRNRLLLEILYPEYCPPVTLNQLSINGRINEIITSYAYYKYFYLLYIKEYILGIDYIDNVIQEEAQASMRTNPNVELQEIKEFSNIKIYTFVRKR